jgi:hypothetical protein
MPLTAAVILMMAASTTGLHTRSAARHFPRLPACLIAGHTAPQAWVDAFARYHDAEASRKEKDHQAEATRTIDAAALATWSASPPDRVCEQIAFERAITDIESSSSCDTGFFCCCCKTAVDESLANAEISDGDGRVAALMAQYRGFDLTGDDQAACRRRQSQFWSRITSCPDDAHFEGECLYFADGITVRCSSCTFCPQRTLTACCCSLRNSDEAKDAYWELHDECSCKTEGNCTRSPARSPLSGNLALLADALDQIWFDEQDGREARADDKSLYGTIKAHDLIW